MAVSYLTQTELSSDISSGGNLDPAVQAAILASVGGGSAFYQTDSGVPPADATTTLPLDSNTAIFSTSGSGTVQTDPNLKSIIMNDAGGNQLYITDEPGAANNITVAMGSGGDSLNLFDGGNDTVYGGAGGDTIGAGAGNDSIDGGAGNDSIFGGSGSDTLIGGEGNNYIAGGSGTGNYLASGGSGDNLIRDNFSYSTGTSTLVAGSGNDTLWGSGQDTLLASGSGSGELHGGTSSLLDARGSTGDYALGSGSVAGTANTIYGGGGADTLYGGGGQDSLYAGSGNTLIQAGSGAGQLLVGGAGNDTIHGVQGDTFQDTGAAGSHNEFWLDAGGTSTAGSTLNGGAGDDTFHIQSHTGNDTITGGGGTDVVGFDRNFSEVSSFTTDSTTGVTDILFSDGQDIKVSGISELQFNDQKISLS